MFPRFAAAWLCVCGMVAGCRSAIPPRERPPPKVTVAKPVLQTLTDYHEFTGQAEAVESADIRARVRGFLQKIDFQEGTEVAAGAVLYEIDPREYRAALARSEADVLRTQAQLALAQSEETRAAGLRTAKAISEEEYQQRVAARQQAEAAVKQAQSAVDLAQLDLSYTTIVAPIAGRVGRTQVTVGNLVGYNEPTLLTSIVRLDPIYVYFDVPERQFLDYQELIQKEGAATAEEKTVPCYVALETETDFRHAGVIDFRESRVDPGTGTVAVRGVLPNPARLISPGMFVRVRVPVGKPHEALLVPQVAIASDQRGDYVLVVKDGKVEYRAIRKGRNERELTIVTQGLAAGDLVVTSGLQKARPGGTVRAEPIQLSPPQPDIPPLPPILAEQPPGGQPSAARTTQAVQSATTHKPHVR